MATPKNTFLQQHKKYLSSAKQPPNHPSNTLGGSVPKTLKFYQALARSRKIPFKNLKKNELIRALKDHL